MLRIEGLKSGYGAIEALHGVDLKVEEGGIAAVVGANGAGKTTLLMTICGQLRPRAGQILFEGEDLARVPTPDIVRRGIAHVPEGRRIFARMTVMENLQLGAYAAPPENFADDLDLVLAIFPPLKDRLEQSGGTLSGGEQQMLAIGRALMSRPRLLLLDEPSLGLAPIIVRRVFDIIRDLNKKRGMTVLLIEQNAFQALRLAGRAYVMVNGRIAREGTGLELLSDPQIQAAYLEGGLGMSAKEAT
jgi:branched-chain amino acid transport system ATP-binding protein